MLILVEGILSGGNLIGALAKKVELTNPDKLIYSGHIYPFRYRIRVSETDPVGSGGFARAGSGSETLHRMRLIQSIF